MRLAYAVSTQPTAFQAIAFSPDLAENTRRLADLGYDGIEFGVREPLLLDLPAVRKLLADTGLPVPAIGTGQAFLADGLSLSDPDDTVRARAIARVETHIDLAAELDALVIFGLILGRVKPGLTLQDARQRAAEALRLLAKKAAGRGVRFVVEPINRYETDLVNTVAEAQRLLDMTGADNVGILFDTFHANIEEPQLEASLKACGPRLWHVHVADSNRWAPGAGHIDFASIVATLGEMGYGEWISAEILGKPDLPAAMALAARTMLPLLHDAEPSRA